MESKDLRYQEAPLVGFNNTARLREDLFEDKT